MLLQKRVSFEDWLQTEKNAKLRHHSFSFRAFFIWWHYALQLGAVKAGPRKLHAVHGTEAGLANTRSIWELCEAFPGEIKAAELPFLSPANAGSLGSMGTAERDEGRRKEITINVYWAPSYYMTGSGLGLRRDEQINLTEAKPRQSSDCTKRQWRTWMQLGSCAAWVQHLAPPLSTCLMWASTHLFLPQFLHVQNGYNCTYQIGLLEK